MKRNVPWNKGKKCPKISKVLKEGYKKGRVIWNKGLTKETNKIMALIALKKIGLKRPDQSKRMKGKNHPFFGKKHSMKTKKMMGKNHWTKNGKWSKEEIKKKIGKHKKGKTYEELYEIKKAQQLKKQISKFMKGKYLGNKNSSKRPEVRKKIRKKMINHIKKNRGNFKCNIGKNEKQILDELELSLGFKIYRQFEVEGYFIDGYIPKLKLAIEIDEKDSHRKPKVKEKDIRREKEIKRKLECEFFRIKDY